jgi:hypothetical protein
MGVALRRGAPPAPEVAPVAPVAAAPISVAASLPPAQLVVPAPGASAEPETIVFSVSVAPATAQVLIDGEPLPSNPFLGRFPKNYGTHRVRAVAPGYQPKERLVSFNDNVMIDLNLNPRPFAPPARREPPRRDPPPHPPTVAPAPPAPPVAAPRPAAVDIQPRNESEPARRRTIDSTNPYGDDK